MSDLRKINREQFRAAKRFWGYALICKITMFAIGTWAVFLTTSSPYVPLLLLVLALASELLQLYSDNMKSHAEGLLRTFDFCHSFGREISEADKRDIIFRVSKAKRREVDGAFGTPYFDSTAEPGPTTAVLNLLESAWYTRQQTFVMAVAYLVLVSLLVILSILALAVVAHSVTSPDERDRVVKAVIGWLLLITSVNMLKGFWGYFRMYQRCQRTEATCGHLIKGEVSEVDALRQWHEYQVARAGAPLIPDWLWVLMRERLDDAWQRAKQ